jgi:hypothetical protein
MFLGLFLVCVFCFSVSGQTKKTRPKIPAHKQNTILASVLSNLADTSVCGDTKNTEKETYAGMVIKRQFDANEVQLSGFVLRDAKDRRTFINLDAKYISERAESASSDLSDFLTKGRRVKVWAYRCGRIFYAYKITEIIRKK